MKATTSSRALIASLFGTAVISLLACSAEPEASPTKGKPKAGAPTESSARTSEAEFADGGDPKNAYLSGVASLGNCTATLLRTSQDPAAPAYLLSAARCLTPAINTDYVFEVHVDAPLLITLPIVFGFSAPPAPAQPAVATATRIAYATMKGVDLALIELNRTVGQLQELGIEPLSLAQAAPGPAAPIEMVGQAFEHEAPEQQPGGPQPSPVTRNLRRARCVEGSRRPTVVEQLGYFYDLHSNACAALGAGTVGSPVLDQNGRVYGVFDMRFTPGEHRQPCYLNYPCEVGGSPEREVPDSNYVADATIFAGCFDAKGRFDLAAGDCKLDAGAGSELGSEPRIAAATYGEPPLPNAWNQQFPTASDTQYRYKVGAAQSVDCRSPEGYSEPLPIDGGALKQLPLPSKEGLYALCILTGTGEVESGAWQSIAHPTIVVRKVSDTHAVDPETSNVTAEQAFSLGQQVLEAYRGNATANRARFAFTFGSAMDTKIELLADRSWPIELGLDFRGGLSADVITLMICHEVGHALAGFPFKNDGREKAQSQGLPSGQYGSVISAEENSDYFASKECLPRLWAGQRAVNAKFRATASEYVKTRCDQVWPGVDEQNLCYRSAAAAESLGRWLGKLDDPMPRVDKPSKTIVEQTLWTYPPGAQCRVDTIFHGALCRTKFRSTDVPGLIEPLAEVWRQRPEVEAAAAPDSCLEGLGARPRCWFAPNTTKVVDCMGIPDGGLCTEHDGQTFIKLCDPHTGAIDETPCYSGEHCGLDEDGARCLQ